MAESFTKIGDGTVWQMKLREGVRFHDGTELDADDVTATVGAQLADPAISLNFPRYCDPERDELMFESRGIDDLDRRVQIWHRIQEMMRDAYTYIFYYHTNWVIGARDNVHNICRTPRLTVPRCGATTRGACCCRESG